MKFPHEKNLKTNVEHYSRGYSQGYDHGTAYAFKASNCQGLYKAIGRAILYLSHTQKDPEAQRLILDMQMEKSKVTDIGLNQNTNAQEK